jgi:peptide/nickel transport system permease protein
LRYISLPAVTMSVIPMGVISRTVRALVAEILDQEFVQALRVKGLRRSPSWACSSAICSAARF